MPLLENPDSGSWSFSLSNSPRSGGEAVWIIKQHLVSQGWSVPRSGGGTGQPNLNGDLHNPAGPYSGTLDLAGAWLELRQPIGASPRRSIMFQVTGLDWGIWYSSDGMGFTNTGTATASVRSTALDEQSMLTSSSARWLPQGRMQVLDIIAGGESEGYSFFVGARNLNMSPLALDLTLLRMGYTGVLSLDVLSGAHPLDPDPAVVGVTLHSAITTGAHFCYPGSPYLGSSYGMTTGGVLGWFRKGTVDQQFVAYPPTMPYARDEGSGGTYVPINGDRLSSRLGTVDTFQTFPILYWRGGSGVTTARGRKGQSVLFRTGQPKIGAFRLNSDMSRMNLGALSVPWDGSTVPII